MGRSNRFALTLSLAAFGIFAFASSAAAAITSSQIVAPASPTFTTFDQNNPNSIAVAGTTSGGNPAVDEVNLDCFAGSEDLHLASSVKLAPDGGFSVPAASLSTVANHVCRLRAVPTGATPADLAPFAGPLLGVGHRLVETIPSGPNAGKPSGFSVTDQQLSAADSFFSLGRCGLVSAGLFNASLERTTTTFGCNDWFWRFDNHEEPGKSTRSQIQIDGVNVYTARSVNEMFGPVEGFPAVTFSSSQDPATGEMTIKDSEALVACQTPAYPPSFATCPTFVSTGVRDERTTEQTADGHLVTITDRYASTDGGSHAVDLLPQNDQVFSRFNENGKAIAYRFPGEGAYAPHALGQTVPFAAATPGTVLVRVEGAQDGDPTTGRGAIVFDRPASPATFDAVNGGRSAFYFHQVATVPAGGSTSFRFAYVQGYAQAEVEALARQAENAFKPAPGPPAPMPSPTPPTPKPPSNRFKFGRVTLNRHNGTAKLRVHFPSAGKLALTSKQVRAIQRKVRRPMTMTLSLRPKRRLNKALKKRHQAKVAIKLTFTPTGGSPRTRVTRLTLIRH